MSSIASEKIQRPQGMLAPPGTETRAVSALIQQGKLEDLKSIEQKVADLKNASC